MSGRRTQLAIVGGIVGGVHMPGPYILTDGRSLHPLQRTGAVPHSGVPNLGAVGHAGLTGAPPVGVGPDLGYPATMTPGIALNPAVRV